MTTEQGNRAMVRIEQAEKLLGRLLELAEGVEDELGAARCALKPKHERLGLPGGERATRPAGYEPLETISAS
jgi:hypothetical protein